MGSMGGAGNLGAGGVGNNEVQYNFGRGGIAGGISSGGVSPVGGSSGYPTGNGIGNNSSTSSTSAFNNASSQQPPVRNSNRPVFEHGGGARGNNSVSSGTNGVGGVGGSSKGTSIGMSPTDPRLSELNDLVNSTTVADANSGVAYEQRRQKALELLEGTI